MRYTKLEETEKRNLQTDMNSSTWEVKEKEYQQKIKKKKKNVSWKKVRQMRKKKWLAEQVGVSKTQFAHWCTNDKEKGYIRAVPSVLNAMALARILDSKVEELFELVQEEQTK